jgi:4-amino-4-deoxy-L-arabinose transferase-like glycosyltransferase
MESGGTGLGGPGEPGGPVPTDGRRNRLIPSGAVRRLPRLPTILIALILALSFGLNARVAAHPRSAYQSADERAYGKLAIDISERHHYGGAATNMQEPLHWPPGAPMLFALGHELFPSASDDKTFDIRSAYWEQALLTTGTTALAALLAWLLAGPWAGVLAAALVGTYPPLIGATGDQLSEPLGAFLLIAAFVTLAWAVRRRAGPWPYAGAGALFALTILTRTDLVLVPFLIAGFGALAVIVRARAWRRALMTWGMVGIAALVVLAPWTIYASAEEGQFVPVTKGSAAALFVGTYLPGGGTTVGMKMALEPELRRLHPELKGVKTYKIPAGDALAIFAARHPELSRDDALQLEARKNLIHYSTHQPLDFASMAFSKAKRMWLFYYRGGGVHYISTIGRAWHIFLVVGAILGLLAGLWRRRDPLLAAVLLTVAFSTAIHTIVVSQARYNLPLMPSLVAAGVAGWWLAVRRRAEPPAPDAPEPAAAPEPAPAAA